MPRGTDTRSDPRRRPEGAWTDWKTPRNAPQVNEGRVVSATDDRYDSNYPRSSYAVEAAQGKYFIGRAQIEAPDSSVTLTSGPVRTPYRAQVAADALQQRAQGSHPDEVRSSRRLRPYV
jgi:hypothetical protein